MDSGLERFKTTKLMTFQYVINYEISSYEAPYSPDVIVVSSSEVARALNVSRYTAKKALHKLDVEGLLEVKVVGNPAIVSFNGECEELVDDARPPKKGYALTKKGFDSQEYKKAYAEWSESLRKLADGEL